MTRTKVWVNLPTHPLDRRIGYIERQFADPDGGGYVVGVAGDKLMFRENELGDLPEDERGF